MRILLINKFLFPQGGADKHVLELADLLRSHGHEVALFGMADPRNGTLPYGRYMVSPIDFSQVQFSWQGIRVFFRMLYSFEAKRKLAGLIKEFRPDIAHIHNIYHQLSPSILSTLKRHRVPIVQTLHDYALVSAQYNLYAHGGICEHGIDGRFWEYVKYRCIKNSRAASLAAAIEMYLHRGLRMYERHVTTFIAPSSYLRETVRKHVSSKLDIRVLHNTVVRPPATPRQPGSHILFLGRLSSEKGIRHVLNAVAGTNVEVRLAGTGPEEAELRHIVAGRKLTNVRFLGQLAGRELEEQLMSAVAVVVPSQWYENCPLVILEAQARGIPVIASRIGGIPEIIRDGATGILVDPWNVTDLRSRLLQIVADRAWGEQIGRLAAEASRDRTPERYYAELMTIYEDAIRR